LQEVGTDVGGNKNIVMQKTAYVQVYELSVSIGTLNA
jgi:hypothetical protein